MADPVFNALDLMTMGGLDRPSYIEDPEEALLRNQAEALQELYAQHGTIGPNPMYDEEGNIIPQELWAPDLSFVPLMSKTSLAAVGSKVQSFFSKSPGYQAANILSKIESKLTPKLATKTLEDISLSYTPKTIIEKLTPTKFSLFIEGLTRKSLLKKLSTPEEYERFKKTYKTAGKLFDYDSYKNFLEVELYPSKKALAIGIDKYKPHIPMEFEKKSIAGKYFSESGLIGMRPSGKEGGGLSGWRSTLRHELKHHLDFEFTGYGNDDYERLRKIFDEGLRPEVKDELLNWKLLQALGGKVAERTPGGVKRINYLKEPTETLARLTEIRTKGAGQTISTLLGKDIVALKQLKSIYKPEFLKTLMKDYWAITPVGLGSEMLESDMYEDLNGKR